MGYHATALPILRRRRYGGGVAYSVLSLFAAGEQGVWLDNSDFTTLFQDAAGTTPVTGYEQFVGLRLDKSRGLVLGSELVTNGTFDANVTGWSTQANVSISWVSGELRAVSTSTGTTAVYQDITTVAGRTYKLSITVRQNTGNTLLLVYNGAFATLIRDYTVTAPTTNTTTNLVFTATGTTTRIGFAPLAVATAFADNISVRELPGNHAYQTTTTARAVLSARYNLLTQTENFSSATWLKIVGVSVTPNQTDPLGGNSASKIDIPSNNGGIYQPYSVAVGASVTYRQRIFIRADTETTINISIQGAGNSGNNKGTQVTVGTSWQPFVFDNTLSVSDSGLFFVVGTAAVTGAAAINASRTVYIWGADLRVANESSALPAYQRVGAAVNGTSTSIGTPDYDTVGFPAYLRYDGGDWYQTNSIDFSTGATNPPLGPELVTNGGFDSATGWSTGGGVWVISGGSASITSSTAALSQSALSAVAGKTYQVTFTISAFTSGGVRIEFGGINGVSRAAAGTYTQYVTATSTAFLVISPIATSTLSLDNISVKELTDSNYAPDKMSVFTGVRKLSDTAQMIVELSASASANNGTFLLNNWSDSVFYYGSRGTTLVEASGGVEAAPTTAILTGLSTISAPSVLLRKNAQQTQLLTSSQGTGNYGNYPLYIGARGGTIYYYQGREYETIVLGRAVTATELANTEGYMEAQTFGKDMAYVYSDELTTATGDLITAADGDQIYMTVTYS